MLNLVLFLTRVFQTVGSSPESSLTQSAGEMHCLLLLCIFFTAPVFLNRCFLPTQLLSTPPHPPTPLPSFTSPLIPLLFSLSLQELKLPVYRAHSPQIGMRRYFADLLAILSNRYQLCPTARHLAVYLLDLFMDHYDVAVKQLYVIALSCLLLASKSLNSLPASSLNPSTCPFYTSGGFWQTNSSSSFLFWDVCWNCCFGNYGC